MRGILYGVGLGPGDPELMTLKAVRMIRENDIIALPGTEPKKTVAYRIASKAVPEIHKKKLLGIYMPMTSDREEQLWCHREGAKRIESCLEEGRDVVFLTLGDVSIYSTFSYLQRILQADGYLCKAISGIPSFCAAAAAVGTPLGLGCEPIHIYPSVQNLAGTLPEDGTVILMKCAARMSEIKELFRHNGREGVTVENCSMENERVWRNLDETPDSTGYFALTISGKKN